MLTLLERFVLWVEAQLGCAYIFGCTGDICTPKQRLARIAQYPETEEEIVRFCPVLSGRQATCTGCKYDGRPAYDCAQLTRYAAEEIGLFLPSGATAQKDGDYWCLKGPISEMPKDRYCFVYRQRAGTETMRHTGIYMADGTYIHAASHELGVRRDKMPGNWTHFGVLRGMYPDLDAKEKEAGPLPELIGTAIVRTKSVKGLSLWSTPEKSKKLIQVPQGAVVEVYSETQKSGKEPFGNFRKASYNGVVGWIDIQYIPEIVPAKPNMPSDILELRSTVIRDLTAVRESLVASLTIVDARLSALNL